MESAAPSIQQWEQQIRADERARVLREYGISPTQKAKNHENERHEINRIKAAIISQHNKKFS